MDKKESRKRTILEASALISIITLAVIGLWFLAEHIQERDEVEPIDSPVIVSLKIKGDGWSIDYLDRPTVNNTVFKILMECSQAYNFSVRYTHWPGYDAVFVNAINGTENGADGMWWQYHVNDEYGEIGCDKKEIFHEDLVEWRFEEPGQ